MTSPRQKPGRSKQDYGTPAVFLNAVHARLGIDDFACDLAATAANNVAVTYYDPAANALVQSWVFDGWCWLNPPFAHLAPWVRRAAEQARLGARVAMLVPAAVGANWWRNHVHGHALALFLNGRITFVGETAPYLKDCALLLYAPTVAPGYDIWRWPDASASARKLLLEHMDIDPQVPDGDLNATTTSPLRNRRASSFSPLQDGV